MNSNGFPGSQSLLDLENQPREFDHVTWHAMMANGIFVVVAAAAVGLGYFVHWAAATPTDIFPPLVPKTLHVIEYGVFVIDIVTYSVYALVNAYGFIKSLF